MKYHIVAVGHRMPAWIDAGCNEYAQRMPQALAREYEARLLKQPLAVHLSPAGGIATQAIAALDISASMIRDSLARGASPRYLLPDPVLD